jgi:hypothetical protein
LQNLDRSPTAIAFKIQWIEGHGVNRWADSPARQFTFCAIDLRAPLPE